IVYVRGGDHGANWPADGNLLPNPARDALQPKMQAWSVATSGGAPKLLAEGDAPVVAPRTGPLAFGHARRIWPAAIGGGNGADPLAVGALGWRPRRGHSGRGVEERPASRRLCPAGPRGSESQLGGRRSARIHVIPRRLATSLFGAGERIDLAGDAAHAWKFHG